MLWLSEQEMCGHRMPERLSQLCRYGLEIHYVSSELTSLNKLYFASKAFPEATLVTADDDIFYPRWWLSGLLEGAKRHPDCVICYRGHLLRKAANGNSLLMRYEDMRAFPMPEPLPPSFALLPTGVSGALYPPGSLPPAFFDTQQYESLSKGCDDIWCRTMTMLNGIRAVRVFPFNLHFVPVLAWKSPKLSHLNIKQGRNDTVLQALFTRYPEAYARIETF